MQLECTRKSLSWKSFSFWVGYDENKHCFPESIANYIYSVFLIGKWQSLRQGALCAEVGIHCAPCSEEHIGHSSGSLPLEIMHLSGVGDRCWPYGKCHLQAKSLMFFSSEETEAIHLYVWNLTHFEHIRNIHWAEGQISPAPWWLHHWGEG